MSIEDWEKKILMDPGAAERVAETVLRLRKECQDYRLENTGHRLVIKNIREALIDMRNTFENLHWRTSNLLHLLDQHAAATVTKDTEPKG